MIERIIENWLNKSSERSYQLPFCYLLQSRGYTVVHLTRHCGMEHGKDIIAVDKDGIVHAYQLKGVNGGKLKLRDWQSGVQGQITQLIETPITHPSVNILVPHKSYLVVNGDIEEEVQHAIYAYNTTWAARGKPEYNLKTILKGEIFNWAIEIKNYFIPSEVNDFQTLLEFYLQSGKGFLEKDKFSYLLNSVLKNERVSFSEAKRLISSTAILCSLGLSSYTEQNNHVAIIEGWLLYVMQIMRFAEIHELEKECYNNEIEIAETIIIQTLENLYEEIKIKDELVMEGVSQDVYVYRYRTTIILGLIAYLGIRKLDTGQNISFCAEIEEYIDAHFKELIVWGESAIPFVLNIYWFFKKLERENKSSQILKILLEVILDYYKADAFTNLYLSAEESALLLLNEQTTTEQIQSLSANQNVIETLIHLIVNQNLKETLQEHWAKISRSHYRDFRFTNSADFYLWRCKQGTEFTRTEKTTHSWNELKKEASQYELHEIPQLLQGYSRLVPLVFMVMPHRMRRNIAVWYNSKNSDFFSGSSSKADDV